MDRYSYDKKKIPGAILLTKNLTSSHNNIIFSSTFGMSKIKLLNSFSNKLFLINKAYKETSNDNCIENILLQRDFIID